MNLQLGQPLTPLHGERERALGGREDAVAGGVAALRHPQPGRRVEGVGELEDEAAEALLVRRGVRVRQLPHQVVQRAVLPRRVALELLR